MCDTHCVWSRRCGEEVKRGGAIASSCKVHSRDAISECAHTPGHTRVGVGWREERGERERRSDARHHQRCRECGKGECCVE